MSFIKMIQRQGTKRINIKTFMSLLDQGKKNFIANLEEDLKVMEDVYKRDSDEIRYTITQINQGKQLTNLQWVNLYNILLKYFRLR